MKVAIIGGSMAGLFAAVALNYQGFDVEVFERSAGRLEGRGAGIVTHPELFAVLARAGISVEAQELGTAIDGRRILDRSGEIICEIDHPQVLTSWGRLYALLKTAFPTERYHGGAILDHVDHCSDKVAAIFRDGRQVECDLLVGADGLFSAVRQQLLPDVGPQYAGYVAWRGLVDQADLSNATRTAICDHFAFCLPQGEQMLGYPVSAPGEEATPRFNFVWYRPARSDQLRELLTDANGELHSLSIPPNAIRTEVTGAMRAQAEQVLAPAFAEVVRKTRDPFVQAILDIEVPTMVPRGRVALIGDAAFVARPHVGAGVTKAASDADCLVSALVSADGAVGDALRRFNGLRQPANAKIVRRARELGAYMQAYLLNDRERALAEQHRTPQAVITETAVMTFLGDSVGQARIDRD